MKKAKVTVDPAYRIGRINERLYGAFMEPIGSSVHNGIWNPNHPTADDLGFRRDIIDAIREFGIPAIRLPGGNFTSSWEWEDSIGPREARRAHLDLAWRQIDGNQVGHDEYLEWAIRAGMEPMYTINMGTADILSAIHCVEYTNQPGGTYWSDLRRKNGYEKPRGVKLWYLGNEMDGPWQVGSWEKDPRGYDARVNETSKAIKWIDPGIRTIVSGTSMFRNPSYPQWDLDVLEQCYENVDYLSLHYYHTVPKGDMAAFVNGSTIFDEMIRTEIGVIDFVKAKTRSPHDIMISFDEYSNGFGEPATLAPGRPGYIPPDNYGEFTREHLDRPYFVKGEPRRRGGRPGGDMLRALSAASILMTFLRHADRVQIGCMTSAIRGAIAYDEQHVWKTGLYHAYKLLRDHGQGVSIQPAVDSPVFDVDAYKLSERMQGPEYHSVPFIEAAAALDEESGRAAVFILNRSWEEAIDVELDVRTFDGYAFDRHIELQSDDIDAFNSFEDQSAVLPRDVPTTRQDGGAISFSAKKLSFNVILLRRLP